LSDLRDPSGPELRKLLSGARRIRCELPKQKAAIETEDIRAMMRLPDVTLRQARDRALVVVGFATALRRSTLAGLRIEDVTFTRDGFEVDVRHEKQDRRGDGRRIAVPHGKSAETCPVRALKRWLKRRGKVPGAIFCNCLNEVATGKPMLGNRITQVVQELAGAIGLDAERYGAHSLRAGFATTALANGAGEIMVARQTGHASLDTLRTYERSRNLFRGNAASLVGL
jgi:integrase